MKASDPNPKNPATMILAVDVLKRSVSYDAFMIFWRIVTQIFFREIRPRGAFNIPRDGPVIFVGAPHNNQVLLA
jgi:1-acyl-sn-glycerol-3-phosphate acyltransferase